MLGRPPAAEQSNYRVDKAKGCSHRRIPAWTPARLTGPGWVLSLKAQELSWAVDLLGENSRTPEPRIDENFDQGCPSTCRALR